MEIDGMCASSPTTITSTRYHCLDDDDGVDHNAEPNTEREARREDGGIG